MSRPEDHYEAARSAALTRLVLLCAGVIIGGPIGVGIALVLRAVFG